MRAGGGGGSSGGPVSKTNPNFIRPRKAPRSLASAPWHSGRRIRAWVARNIFIWETNAAWAEQRRGRGDVRRCSSTSIPRWVQMVVPHVLRREPFHKVVPKTAQGRRGFGGKGKPKRLWHAALAAMAAAHTGKRVRVSFNRDQERSSPVLAILPSQFRNWLRSFAVCLLGANNPTKQIKIPIYPMRLGHGFIQGGDRSGPVHRATKPTTFPRSNFRGKSTKIIFIIILVSRTSGGLRCLCWYRRCGWTCTESRRELALPPKWCARRNLFARKGKPTPLTTARD